MKSQERWLIAGDRTRLFTRWLEPLSTPRANVLAIHGLGEHSSRYLHVAQRLCDAGFGVCLFDLRGHGRSNGARGHIDSYVQLLDDVALVWAEYSRTGIPSFLYGHSLGGQAAINFALRYQPIASGVIAASPWLELAFAPHPRKLRLAACVGKIWPRFTLETELRLDRLSRDQQFLASMPDLDLVHHRISARMFFELSNGASDAVNRAPEFCLPLLLLHGENDPVTSPAASRRFFESSKSPDKTLRLYPGGMHETHNDLDRDKVLSDIVDWIAARC